MVIFAFMIPLFVLGTVAWFIIGLLRTKASESFTIATATSFYAHLMLIVGLLGTLAGAALAFKVAMARTNLRWAYVVYEPRYGGPSYGAPTSNQLVQAQVAQETVLAVTLITIGILVAVAHALLIRFIREVPGASPRWITRGSLVATTVLTAVAGLGGAVLAVYLTLVFFLVPVASDQPSQPFADSVGMALFFLPAWLVCMTRLVRGTREARPVVGAALVAS